MGKLSFVPAAGQTGTPYTTFTFQVQDDGGTSGTGAADLDPTPRTMTVNVHVVAVTTITNIVIGDDTAMRHQRSRIDKLQVTFERGINVGASNIPAAFTLTRLDDNSTVVVTVTWNANFTVATITFANGQADVYGRSLTDGNYQLHIDGSQLRDVNGVQVDADGDSVAGGTKDYKFYRFFGDFVTTGRYHEDPMVPDSWRSTDVSDLPAFRATFGFTSFDPEYESAFDVDGDGDVDADDLAAFRGNFGRGLNEISGTPGGFNQVTLTNLAAGGYNGRFAALRSR